MLKKLLQQYALVIRIGSLTGLAIILFELINFFVLFRQIKLDYYLSLIAVIFLLAGIWISKYRSAAINPIPTEPVNDYQLTAKEREILGLIAAGKANKEIAALLYVEMSTVKTHINNIYNKLSVTNRKDAQAKYAEITRMTP